MLIRDVCTYLTNSLMGVMSQNKTQYNHCHKIMLNPLSHFAETSVNTKTTLCPAFVAI